jgi:hypothetical protein
MATIEVGIRIDPLSGVAYFGIEAINQKLAAGAKIRELRPGGLVTTELASTDGKVTNTFAGCQIVVVLEDG